MVGAPFPQDDPTPRAVTKSYFHEICAGLGGVQYLDTNEMNREVWWDEGISVLDILNMWVEKLNDMEATCVSTGGSENVLWEYWCVICTLYNQSDERRLKTASAECRPCWWTGFLAAVDIGRYGPCSATHP